MDQVNTNPPKVQQSGMRPHYPSASSDMIVSGIVSGFAAGVFAVLGILKLLGDRKP